MLRRIVTLGNDPGMSILDTSPDMDASAFIEAEGGPASVAQKIKGVSCASRSWTPGAVRAWKHRNEFPREAWPELSLAFPDLTTGVLLKLEARAKSAREGSAPGLSSALGEGAQR